MPNRVLIIDDDTNLTRVLEVHLSDLGCRVDVATDGRTGLSLARRERFELVVLDLMLPHMEGLEICRRLRAEGNQVPVLMLTSKASEIDRVLGLEIGADDYVTKPFSMREFIARVKVILRRRDRQNVGVREDGEILLAGPLTINRHCRSVIRDGQEIALTAKEFDLLCHFAETPGRVFTRSQLLDQVWGYDHDGYEHTVNSHINRLRNKIEANPQAPELIITVWGIGYRFQSKEQA